ncbi:MAG TPA: iron-sulfur cluster assembly scaffold protein [Rhizomicrobium sp.]|nr:iron-sulfur cluster assembly scaffold protein [Rhizomicrobium sp.]
MSDHAGDPLYRRDLLRLAADAIGAGHLTDPDAMATAHNPACGDRITVEITLAGSLIQALAHTTQACVLTQASAALLAAQAPGRDQAALTALAGAVGAFLDGGKAPAGYEVFDGVVSHPGRQVCVMLPFQAAMKALKACEPGGAGT